MAGGGGSTASGGGPRCAAAAGTPSWTSMLAVERNTGGVGERMDGWGAFPLQKKKKKVHPRETKRNNQPWRRTDAHDARALARAASPIRQAHPPTTAPPRHRRPNTTVVGLSFLPSPLPPLPTRSARPLAWREEPRRETRPIQPPIAARARDAPPRAPTSDKRRGGTPRPAAGTMASAGSRRPLSSTPHPRHRREFYPTRRRSYTPPPDMTGTECASAPGTCGTATTTWCPS